MSIRSVRYSDEHRYTAVAAGDEAVKLWKAWAASVKPWVPATCSREAWRVYAYNRQLQETWRLYARGEALSAIAAKMGCSKRRVSWRISAVLAANPPPLPNPWRRTNRYAAPKNPRASFNAARQRRRKPIEQEDDFWLT